MDKALLKLIATKLASLIGGPFTWAWAKILFLIENYVVTYITKLLEDSTRAKNEKNSVEDLNKIESDPNSTAQDRAKEYEKLINNRK